MGFPLAKTPARIKVRLWAYDGLFYVMQRLGDCWESVASYTKRGNALRWLEDYWEDKLAQWSRKVKIRAGFVCEKCGESNRKLLESHHKNPKEQFPEQIYDIDNGECDCVWRHALNHANDPVVQNLILLRLLKILTNQCYKHLSICQKELLGAETD